MRVRSLNLDRAGNLTLLLLLAASLSGCDSAPEPVVLRERLPAPDFSLAVLGERAEVSLADLRGKIVVIDFWATWCAPCEFQVPELNAFWDAHREDSDLRLYGISIDTEGPAVVEKWVGEQRVRYPILLSGEDLARRFGASGFPTLYVIGPDGMIDSTHIGLIERGELEEVVSRLRGR